MARIVLIEDDPSQRTLVQHTLEGDGHTVITAADGRSGLKRARESEPDLVLTDVKMPDTDGLEVIMELRHRDPRTRVIAMTGDGCINGDALLRMARQLGAWGVLPKPFSSDDLKRCIDAALHRDESAAADGRP